MTIDKLYVSARQLPAWLVLPVLMISAVLLASGCQQQNPQADQQTRSAQAPTGDLESPGVAAVEGSLARGVELLFEAPSRFEFPKAAAALEQAVDANPDDPKARLMLVYALNKTAKYDEAKPHLDAAREARERLELRDQLWLDALTARVNDARLDEPALWQRVVQAFPDDRWAWYELASSHLTLEQFTQSAEAARQALLVESAAARWEASWIYYLHSKALFRSGRFAEAVLAAEAGKSNSTTWRSTYFRQAMALAASGEIENVENLVDRYREISLEEGRNNESYTEANIALFYHELGDYSRAVAHARRSHKLDPGAYQSWALAYCLTDNQQPEEALKVLAVAAEAYPEDAHVMASKSYALLLLGDLEQAKQSIEAAQAASARENFSFSQIAARIDRRFKSNTNGAESGEQAPRLWLG